MVGELRYTFMHLNKKSQQPPKGLILNV